MKAFSQGVGKRLLTTKVSQFAHRQQSCSAQVPWLRQHYRFAATSNVNSLQDRYWMDKICHGCGPLNEKGLQIKSFLASENLCTEHNALVAECLFTPCKHHLALDNVVNGGIISSILDCHANILACYAVNAANAAAKAESTSEINSVNFNTSQFAQNNLKVLDLMTVTGQLNVKFRAATPLVPLRLVAMVMPDKCDFARGKIWVEAFLLPAGVTATGRPPDSGLWNDAQALVSLKKNATSSCEALFVVLK